MNIKELIEAGAYPKDEKGRALVPTNNPQVRAVIATTDCPAGSPLLGWLITSSLAQNIGGRDVGGTDYCWSICWWRPDGSSAHSDHKEALLPPPPRKVRARAFGVMTSRDNLQSLHFDRLIAEQNASRFSAGRVVELTGEYEETWEFAR